MKDGIKLQVMNDRVMERGSMETFNRREREYAMGARLAPMVDLGDGRWEMPRHEHIELRRSTHEIHEFRLACQTIRVAYDPETSTLYIGEPEDRYGYVFIEAQRAHERGDLNPYMGAVYLADRMRADAVAFANRESAAKARHASVVAEAVERLKSRKPGVRRRAKRLLAKLGK